MQCSGCGAQKEFIKCPYCGTIELSKKKSRIEKDWIYKDLRCFVKATELGHRCGYVGIDSRHPLYKIDWNDEIEIPETLENQVMNEEIPIDKKGVFNIFDFLVTDRITPAIIFNVHGGITFSGFIEDPELGGNDLWWFGYDCAHAGDSKDLALIDDPALLIIEMGFEIPGIIRTLGYCRQECELLADQLVKYKLLNICKPL